MYFPLFPLFAWAIFGHWQPFLLWLVPLGAALGIAMNISNTLPDLESDLAAGMHGLPHLLGLRWGLTLAWGLPLLVLASMWLLDFTGLVPAHGIGLVIATAGGLLSSALPPALYLRHPDSGNAPLDLHPPGAGNPGPGRRLDSRGGLLGFAVWPVFSRLSAFSQQISSGFRRNSAR